MGGFLPKPVSKVSWTEVFKADVGRGKSSERGHFKDFTAYQRRIKDMRRGREVKTRNPEAGELLSHSFK